MTWPSCSPLVTHLLWPLLPSRHYSRMTPRTLLNNHSQGSWPYSYPVVLTHTSWNSHQTNLNICPSRWSLAANISIHLHFMNTTSIRPHHHLSLVLMANATSLLQLITHMTQTRLGPPRLHWVNYLSFPVSSHTHDLIDPSVTKTSSTSFPVPDGECLETTQSSGMDQLSSAQPSSSYEYGTSSHSSFLVDFNPTFDSNPFELLLLLFRELNQLKHKMLDLQADMITQEGPDSMQKHSGRKSAASSPPPSKRHREDCSRC